MGKTGMPLRLQDKEYRTGISNVRFHQEGAALGAVAFALILGKCGLCNCLGLL